MPAGRKNKRSSASTPEQRVLEDRIVSKARGAEGWSRGSTGDVWSYAADKYYGGMGRAEAKSLAKKHNRKYGRAKD